jgi:glycolate oxidase FAD binding subunit
MTTIANLANRLESLLGASRVVAAEEELRSYAVDGLVPKAIVRPASANEIADVARFALTEKLALVPCGSRSKLEMGMPPTRYDVAVDVSTLQSIAHYDAGDLTLAVDAGMSLRQLEEFLATNKQFLPLAVPCFESSTVGGAVASGIDSALRQQYGTARDFLIGAEFVDGKGELCKSGGRVVKNVTGYDLHKLLIGSLGTLGIITRLNFWTFPLPERTGGCLASFASSEDALAYRNRLAASGLPLTNLDLFDPEVASILVAILNRTNVGLPASLETNKWCVSVSFEGSDRVLRRIVADLEGHARGSHAAAQEVLETAVDEALGGMLREAFEWLRWAAPLVALFRIMLPRTGTNDLKELAQLAAANSLRHALLVRSAGVIYLALLAENDDGAALDALKKSASGVFSVALNNGGHAQLLHAPADVKQYLASANPNNLNMDLEKRIKRAFDPQNIFAPGRIVGGV